MSDNDERLEELERAVAALGWALDVVIESLPPANLAEVRRRSLAILAGDDTLCDQFDDPAVGIEVHDLLGGE